MHITVFLLSMIATAAFTWMLRRVLLALVCGLACGLGVAFALTAAAGHLGGIERGYFMVLLGAAACGALVGTGALLLIRKI